jgi:sterol desaturase/sphingolipid hydroxylase (fatty acid hydroxylase superfamily)
MHWLRTDGGLFWAIFSASFLGVAIWESIQPWRELTEPVEQRWRRHAVLYLVSFAVSAVLLPLSPVLLAAKVAASPYGLLNRAAIGTAPKWIVAILALDLIKYFAHRALHSFRLLWRVHEVHHSDRDFDVSLALRAHPIEVIWLQAATLAGIALLAPPAGAVLAVQLVSVFESFFSHANASLPQWLQRILGWAIYTCDTHRIHHTTDLKMQNSNFGDILPWWDQLFGTYVGPHAVPAERMTIGIEESNAGERPGTVFLLKQPFAR